VRTGAYLGGASLAALVAASGSAAALDAEDVWQNLREAGEISGLSVSGTPTPVDGGLRIEGLAYSRDGEGGAFAVSLDRVRLIEREDGSVEVVLPASMPLDISATPEQGPAVDMRLTLAAEDLVTVAREADGDDAPAGAIAYSYSAPEVTVTLDSLGIDGEPAEAAATLSLADILGREVLATDGALHYALDLTTGQTALRVDFTPPEESGRVGVDAALDALSARSRTTVPAGVAARPLGPALRAGLAGESDLRLSGLVFTVDVSDAQGAARTLSGGIATLSQETVLSAERARYGFEQTDTHLSFAGPDVPGGEVGLRLARLATSVAAPLAASEKARDLELSLAIEGLEAEDTLWATFDPGGVLPRDPAALTLDLAGRGRWTKDILEPQVMAELDAPPGTLESLTIEALRLAALGAEVTADGSFAFEPADFESFRGLPRPEGSVEITARGVNGLLDRLVDAGFIGPDQANGARMMLGLFARPGDGEDKLVSKIEITPDGRILANGTPLQ